MAEQADSLRKIRAIREQLIAKLAILDALGEHSLAAELYAVIQLINELLGYSTTSARA